MIVYYTMTEKLDNDDVVIKVKEHNGSISPTRYITQDKIWYEEWVCKTINKRVKPLNWLDKYKGITYEQKICAARKEMKDRAERDVARGREMFEIYKNTKGDQ